MNPFNPNSVVTPTLFAGRTKQVLAILRKLQQVQEGMSSNFVIFGERGIGKTALAKLVMHVAQKDDDQLCNLKFLTSYYSIEKNQTFESALQASLNALTDKLPKSAIENLTVRMGQFFSNGKFSLGAYGVKVGYQSGGTNSLKQSEVNLKDIAVSAIGNILRSINESTSKGTTQTEGILIVLDEIHNLSDLKGAAQILRGITTTLDIDSLGQVSFLIIGYPDAVRDFFEGDPSAKRSFDQIPLYIMPTNEAAEILEKGFKKINVQYDAKDLLKRVVVAGGYPHSIQVLGHNLIEIHKDGVISKTDWDSAEATTARELQRKDFSGMYNFSGKSTLREEILNFMALVARPILKSDLAKEIEGNIYDKAYLPALKRSGAIREEQATGMLRLHSLLFRSAILAHIIHKGKQPKLLDRASKYWTSNSDAKEI